MESDVFAVLTGSDDCHVCVALYMVLAGVRKNIYGSSGKGMEEKEVGEKEGVTRVRRGD